MHYKGEGRTTKLALTPLAIGQLALEAGLRDMRIGEFVSELVTATIQKNFFNGCSIFREPLALLRGSATGIDKRSAGSYLSALRGSPPRRRRGRNGGIEALALAVQGKASMPRTEVRLASRPQIGARLAYRVAHCLKAIDSAQTQATLARSS